MSSVVKWLLKRPEGETSPVRYSSDIPDVDVNKEYNSNINNGPYFFQKGSIPANKHFLNTYYCV